MILVVDSGSTKTDWIAVDAKGKILFSTQTLGLNPQVLSSAILKERIINNFDLYQNREQVTHLYFYGAGCGVESPQLRINKVFDEIFTNAEKTIKEDTYAAVYAASKPEEKAVVCILGTGSNCTYFDGKVIEQRVTSLGYILMDEASGNFYGKQLIRSYYFNTMPKSLANEFEKEYDLSPDSIKENIYRRENPNTYLATFSKFLIKHKDNELFQKIIKNGLERFINHQILQFDNAREVPIHFIGSISFFLKEEIKQALEEKGLTMGRIVQRPIEELVKYHIRLLR
ncbi:N-acetylglucosamine kinase [Flavobacteriaceae bacterium]|jgi:N-acetylglucosamine kinase-like BadF-type ATPase|nr:N-acetylglucosamine kinase [Flavobacteriaceae bacterium]MDC0916932.1 N-acetylglucosamine kinase [Flavobacteriaceae bacterium]MDC3330056.1 N-acetylglucosamine kinase [Flavobacteriaceae bacterium]